MGQLSSAGGIGYSGKLSPAGGLGYLDQLSPARGLTTTTTMVFINYCKTLHMIRPTLIQTIRNIEAAYIRVLFMSLTASSVTG